MSFDKFLSDSLVDKVEPLAEPEIDMAKVEELQRRVTINPATGEMQYLMDDGTQKVVESPYKFGLQWGGVFKGDIIDDDITT